MLGQRLTDDEMVVIDKVGKEEVNCVGELDLDVVRGLYRRGLVWLEVPVYPDDHFQGQCFIIVEICADCENVWKDRLCPSVQLFRIVVMALTVSVNCLL